MTASDRRRPRRWRKILRRTVWASLAVGLFLGLLTVFWLRGALYRRWIQFPREAAAWAALRADRQPVADPVGWREFRGVLHSHSEHSHDCEVPFPEILRVLKATGRDFIAMSDHCVEGRADFNLQWRGLHDGILFIPGFEMKQGYMPFGVAAGVVLSNTMPGDLIAQRTLQHGGVLFFAHPEEPRDWDCPELTGMEIYNTHADLKDEPGLGWLLPDLLVNHRRYPDHVMRRIFDPPQANLRRWDELNRTRPLTGIAGNDCHQNTGFRGFYTADGAIRIEDTSPETLKTLRLNPVTRCLARLCFGPLEPGRQLFHVQLDPYERMVRYVATHLLAQDLSEPALLEALRVGRAFVSFDLIADATGFRWFAETRAGRSVMGESCEFSPDLTLRALSPQHCRFTILRDGETVHQTVGRDLTWSPPVPGNFRVEAELHVAGAWVPWVYANPVRLHPAAVPGAPPGTPGAAAP